jgi:23S rRNA (pseudouridine1915-N3)-methyltransferase
VKFTILAVGTRMPSWVEAGYVDYARRMPRELAVELVEIKPERRGSGQSPDRILSAERGRIEAAMPPGVRRVVLDERGASWSTVDLAQHLRNALEGGRASAFVIGGADGTDPALRQSADLVVSLSRLTLPHALVRVVLAEQLYRAASILSNHPYHRA